MGKTQRIIITTPGQLRNQSARRDPKRDRVKAAIERVKDEQKDALTPELWLRELLAIPEIDSVAILKQLPDFRWARKGMWIRGSQMFSPEAFAENVPGDGVEHFLAQTWGDGVYQLQAIALHAQRGGFQFTVSHGVGPPQEANGATDVDAALATVAKRETNIASIRQLRALNDTGGEEPMKMGEVAVLIEAIAKLNRSESRDSRTDEILAKILEKLDVPREAPSPFAAILGPLVELVGKNPSGAWPFLRMALDRVAPAAPRPDTIPPKSFMESAQDLMTGLGPLLANLAQTPVGKAILDKMAEGITNHAQPNGGVIVTERPTIIEAEPIRETLPPRPRGPFDDILDAIVEHLRRAPDDRDFPALVAFLDSIVLDAQTGERLIDRIAPIAKTSDDLARVALKQMDPRLTEQAWDGARAFLDYLREHPRDEERE